MNQQQIELRQYALNLAATSLTYGGVLTTDDVIARAEAYLAFLTASPGAEVNVSLSGRAIGNAIAEAVKNGSIKWPQ